MSEPSEDMPGVGPILVVGRTGQLARALRASDRKIISLDRSQLDLSADPAILRDTIRERLDQYKPIGVINAAAYTAVDQAESEYDVALAVNGRAPGLLAACCADRDLPFLHISTDYVFSGDADTPYRPDRPTDPVNAYGRSKEVGEVAIRAAGARYAILRTSWVYDPMGRNFLTTMLRLAETRDSVSVVDDQIGRPTYAPDLARAALAALDGLMADQSLSSTYHVSNAGLPISWAGFARAIFREADLCVDVKPIASSDYPTPARRPAYSVLDISQFTSAFGFSMPDWQDGLRRALATMKDRSDSSEGQVE